MARVSKLDKQGFTLIEMLVVIAIIGVLASIVFVVGMQSRARARAASCGNQMRQIGMALSMRAERGVPKRWPDSIEKWSSHKPLLLCPEGPQDGMTNYAVNERLVGRPAHAADTGATVLLYESERAGTIMTGDESDVDERHLGGSNYVYLDGHTKWCKDVPQFGP